MFTKACLLLLLAEVSLGIQLYLSPPPNDRLLSSTISPKQARVVVSHQLGLDAFDSVEDMDPSTERLISSNFIGEGVKNALLVTVSEDVARGMYYLAFPKFCFLLLNYTPNCRCLPADV